MGTFSDTLLGSPPPRIGRKLCATDRSITRNTCAIIKHMSLGMPQTTMRSSRTGELNTTYGRCRLVRNSGGSSQSASEEVEMAAAVVAAAAADASC